MCGSIWTNILVLTYIAVRLQKLNIKPNLKNILIPGRNESTMLCLLNRRVPHLDEMEIPLKI